MKEKREKRLNSEFQKNIYELLTTRVKDARLTEMFSITAVHTTADLKQAKVYVSLFSGSEEAKQSTFAAICENAGFLRRELSRSMHIRTVPEFIFLRDRQEEYGEKIEKILSGLTYGASENDGDSADKNGAVGDSFGGEADND